MTILFAASEMVPFCKTGGLADVIGALTPVLTGMGHSVHVMLPGHKTIDRARYGFTMSGGHFEIQVGKHSRLVSVSTAGWNGVKVHLLENDDYFGREGLYGDADGDYADNGSRFIFFSRAVLIVAKHHKTMKELAERYPEKISVMLKFDNDTAHLIYAGSDAFLMPSRYEPCGLGQLIGMRYGALPIVHATGGLADTVRDIDSYPGDGTGFSFSDYTAEALIDAVFRALRVFRSRGRKRWTETVRRAMEQDYSWENSARKYIDVYCHIGNHTTL